MFDKLHRGLNDWRGRTADLPKPKREWAESRLVERGRLMNEDFPRLLTRVGRGAGWGALLGAVGGFFVPLFSQFSIGGGELSEVPVLLLIGLYTVIFGALYGCLAGVMTSLALARNRRRGPLSRLLGATVAAASVIVVSWLVFGPSLEVGPNETVGHVRERVAIFYAVPGLLAFVGGFAMTPRLNRPVTDGLVNGPVDVAD